jgi:hypothetical protein
MADIRVVFPDSGAPYVYSHSEAVKPEEPIFWHVASFNKNVTRVQIKFEGAKQEYFPNNATGGFSFIKNLKEVPYDRDKNTKMLEGLVWADAPPYKTYEVEKYWVIGLDDSGNEVPGAFLDPKIIVDGP